MASKSVKVTYQDGREETVKVLPRALVMAEQHFGGIKPENALSATFYFGWAALIVAGKEKDDYETWLNKVDDVEDILPDEDGDAADRPTQPDPSGDTSSD